MKTLLLLEDEELVMHLLHHILAQFNLLEANTAAEALRLVADHDRQIDLLLADVSLPASSGIQVALLLRSRVPGLPVILMSGYPVTGWSKRDIVDLENLGSHSVTILQKPFRAHVLFDAVGELIGAPAKVRTA